MSGLSSPSHPAERSSPTPDLSSPAPYEDQLLGFRGLVPGSDWRFEAGKLQTNSSYQSFGIDSARFVSWRWEEDETEIAVASMILSHELSPRHLPVLVASSEEAKLPPSPRMAGEVAELNGYPTFVAGYEADGTKATYVYLLAGRRFFILALEGPGTIVPQHVPLFERLLASFHPLPLLSRGEEAADAPYLPHSSGGHGLGFTIRYPEGWRAERVGEDTLVVSGPVETELSGIHVSVHFSGLVGDESRLYSTVQGFREQFLVEYPHAALSQSSRVRMAQGLLRGLQFHADYNAGSVSMRQWMSAVRDDEGHLFFLFLRGPKAVIQEHGGVINRMLDSLTPAH